ncbi:MAG: virulence factor family protein [Geminicoccaceae bacterium]|nr:virulence factor family protein [Geminicoccaceae bacterium]
MRLLLRAVLLLALLPGAAGAATIAAGRMGDVPYLAPDGEPRAVVFLFSGGAGWNAGLDDAALALRGQGAAVLEVDLPRYLKGLLASKKDGCHYLGSEIEDTSHRLQAELGTTRYLSPILAGTGAGGALAYAALAQAPAATIAGAASDGFDVKLDTRVPLCAGALFARAPDGWLYAPKARLPGWWRVLPQPRRVEEARAFAGAIDGAKVVEDPPDSRADLAGRFLHLLEGPIAKGAEPENAIADLPLTELPVEGGGDLMALVWSGDGGWRDLDKTVGERLQAKGIPVVGVDSLRYFWQEKTPDEVAGDLADMILTYGERWHRPKVLLIGYSFGADVLPFAVNRLPDDVRDRVVRLSLLGFSPTADFGIHVAGWLLSLSSGDALPTPPEVVKLDKAKVQCFYGKDEDDTACPDAAFDGAERVETHGGHHFDGDYGALADRILKGLRTRSVVLP